MTKKRGFYKYPDWVSGSVVYQIFPDRFRRSGAVKHQEMLKLLPWSEAPSQKGFHGGDLYGILDSLEYLQSFGINCIYLNPIFLSTANHRYHTSDYFTVDPILGGNKAFDLLIKELHSRKMKIILDGVFNHCGRGFWAFNDVLENGKQSPYIDWFKIYKWPLSPYPKRKKDCGYYCWWNNPALPKFNHHNLQVREYLISVATYWMEKGIDGWRLDVPDEIPFDFWIEFRERVKEINPRAWILGEIWGDASPWLQGDGFDGVMNYRIGWSTLCWAGGEKLQKKYINPSYPISEIDTNCFLEILKKTFSSYCQDINNNQLNLLDSHDVPRALNTLKGDLKALKIALLILFLQPGAPCIYYGTEKRLSGGQDPKCREPFPWDETNNEDLNEFIRSLGELRKTLDYLNLNTFNWEGIGSHGLKGTLVNEQNRLIAKPRRKVFINRSRKNWLEIPNMNWEKIFFIGAIDLLGKGIGPQSAVLLSSSIDDCS